MKLFKDSNGNTFAYEADGSQDHLIGENLIAITQEEELSLNQARAEQVFSELSYSEKRRIEYPDFRDYLDGVVKGNQAQIDAYISACQAVKAKYPKV